MNGLYTAALEVQGFLQDRHWRFCIIGGLAVLRWGQARTTQDVDISLLTGFGSEKDFIEPLLDHFTGRIPDAAGFALENRVLLLSASNGIPLDVTLAAYPYEEQVISRASEFVFAPRVSLVTASAEDLIVLKAFAGRDQDWADVEGIAIRQSGQLDWNYIISRSTALGEIREETDALERLEDLRRQEAEP